MTKLKDYEELIARVDERTKVLPTIEQHLRKLNDSVAEVTRIASVNRSIADNAMIKAEDACKQSDGNRRLIILVAIAGIGGLAAILAQVV